MNILFVCTGNTCRSPMAELYFNRLMVLKKAPHTAASAGLSACSGCPISQHSFEVMQTEGIDASAFRSSALTRYALEQADRIICMTRSHVQSLLSVCPEYRHKTHTLSEWSGGSDVPDPFGGDLACYRKTFEKMRTALEILAEDICSQGENDQ